MPLTPSVLLTTVADAISNLSVGIRKPKLRELN